MTSILNTIIKEKKREVERLKVEEIAATVITERHSFIHRLQNNTQLAIIAEFKRASPSKGDINLVIDPERQAFEYEKYGAAAISVLTDSTFFKGSFADLTAISNTVNIPVLCKDFIIDEKQIMKAKMAGADLILLIAAVLERKRLNELYSFAIQNGLDVLIETHNEMEVEMAIETGTKLIGVNNRDLNTFKVDLKVTDRLAPLIKNAGSFLISESGIQTAEDCFRVQRAGADGILVGEAFMKARNLHHLMKMMKQQSAKGVNTR